MLAKQLPCNSPAQFCNTYTTVGSGFEASWLTEWNAIGTPKNTYQQIALKSPHFLPTHAIMA